MFPIAWAAAARGPASTWRVASSQARCNERRSDDDLVEHGDVVSAQSRAHRAMHSSCEGRARASCARPEIGVGTFERTSCRQGYLVVDVRSGRAQIYPFLGLRRAQILPYLGEKREMVESAR